MLYHLRFRLVTVACIQKILYSPSTLLFGGLQLGNVLAFAYQMIMSRLLSPGDYGALVTLTSASYILGVLMHSIQVWVIKEVTAAGEKDAGRARHVFGSAMCTLAPWAAVAFLADWIGSRWIAGFLNLGAVTPVIVLGVYAALSFLLPIPRGLLLGLDRLRLASFIFVLEPMLRLAIALVLVVLGLGVSGALVGYAGGSLIALAVAVALLWPVLGRQRGTAPALDSFTRLNGYGLRVFGVNTCLMVVGSLDQIAVKHFFSAEVAGNFAVAFLLGRVIMLTTMSLGLVIFARSATMPLHDRGRMGLLIKGLVLVGLIGVTLTGVYVTIPNFVVHVMAGSQYAMADTYVGLVGIEMTLFGLVYVQAYYQISLGKMQIIWPLGLAVALQLILLAGYHATVQQILMILIAVMGGLLVCVSGLSWRASSPKGHAIPNAIPESPQTGADFP
jgi:O-antigen/teichoic acid export membrane protein